MSEASLKQYLLDQQVDPVEQQMTHIQLDLIKRLDQNRITNRTKYTLEQTVRSGQHTGFYVPRIPEQITAKQVVVPSNIAPNAMRIGDTLYKRFLFSPIKTLPKLVAPEITFPVAEDHVLSKNYLHKHDVSLKDQLALDGVRKRQLKEELDKLEKLAKQERRKEEVVGHPYDLMADLADPLHVTSVPTTPTNTRSDDQVLLRNFTRASAGKLPLPDPADNEPDLLADSPETPAYRGLGKRTTRPSTPFHSPGPSVVSVPVSRVTNNMPKGHLTAQYKAVTLANLKKRYGADRVNEAAYKLIRTKGELMMFEENLQR